MNFITALIIGLLLLLAYCVIYHLVKSNNINDMKRTMWANIKSSCLEDIGNFLALWLVCSVLLWTVVNACGLMSNLFIATDINGFEAMFEAMSYDPLTNINITTSS